MVYARLIIAFVLANVQSSWAVTCGVFGAGAASTNTGLSLDGIETIFAFGDGYTDAGNQNGSTPLPPAVANPPDPKAGGRWSNGKVWTEYLASDIGATLKNYAVAGSVVDNTMYSGYKLDSRDFLYQANFAISSNSGKTKPDPATTLYVFYLGMEDFKLSPPSSFQSVADTILFQLIRFSSSPLYATNFLVVDSYGRGKRTIEGEAYKQELFDGLTTLSSRGLNIAFVDMGEYFDDVTADIEAAGFEDIGPCTVNATTSIGQCSAPDKTVYYIEDFPSTSTQQKMAEFAKAAIETCEA